MDLSTLIKTRRTIHRYLDQSIDPQLISNAIEMAHYAPNHKHTWPWRFTVVGPETKTKIDQAALAMKEVNGPLQGGSLTLFNEKRVHPSLVVVSQCRSSDPHQSREDYAAVACAVQNFCLYLHSQGVGTKWSTGSLIRHPKAYEIMEINPQAEEIVGFLWCGYASQTPEVKRPSLDDVVRKLA